jgi:hypothetical protein
MLSEIQVITQKLNAKEEKKKKAKEGRFNPLAGRVGLLTPPEGKEKYDSLKGNWKAKDEKQKQIAAAKETEAVVSDMRMRTRAADGTHWFWGTFKSYLTLQKDDILVLALSLHIPVCDSKRKEFKKADIFATIAKHFDDHPDLKSQHRYIGLFDGAARIQRPKPGPRAPAPQGLEGLKPMLDNEDDQDVAQNSDFGDGGHSEDISDDEQEVDHMYGVNGED